MISLLRAKAVRRIIVTRPALKNWWSTDSNPSTRMSALPPPAWLSSASPASSKRQLVGKSPDWVSARTASAAAPKSLNGTEAEARKVGLC